MSRQAARLRSHLAAETRGANGIGSLGRLIGYLRELRDGRDRADDDLLVGLEGLRTERHLRALFDESLPVTDLRRRGRGGVEHRRAGAAHASARSTSRTCTTGPRRASVPAPRSTGWPPTWRNPSSSAARTGPTSWWWKRRRR